MDSGKRKRDAAPKICSLALMVWEALLPDWVSKDLETLVRVIFGCRELKEALFTKLVMRRHPTWQLACNDLVEVFFLSGYPNYTDVLRLGSFPWRVKELLKCVHEGVSAHKYEGFEGNVRISHDGRTEILIKTDDIAWLIDLYESMLNAHYDGCEWDPDMECEFISRFDESTAPDTIQSDCIRYEIHGCSHVLTLVEADLFCVLDGDVSDNVRVEPRAVYARMPRLRLIVES